MSISKHIHFVTDNDILVAKTDAIVNTVNCEGYMGKGLAYQFKKHFPNNNKAYISACKNGELVIGSIFPYEKETPIIINFPTKNEWKKKSEYKYIEDGLNSLVAYLKKKPTIKSIAIPQLGCGNGGLEWKKVYNLIESKLQHLDAVTIQIYGESPKDISERESKSLASLKPSLSWIVFLSLEQKLSIKDELVIQKACYMVNVYLGKEYFKHFIEYHRGPYSLNVHNEYEKLREYRNYHKKESVDTMKKSIWQIIVSESVKKQAHKIKKTLDLTVSFFNTLLQKPLDTVDDDIRHIELYVTIIAIVKESSNAIALKDIEKKFLRYFDKKSQLFSTHSIEQAIQTLLDISVIQKDIIGELIYNKEYFKTEMDYH